MEKQLLLKCLEIMTLDQKSKVNYLLKWESEYKKTIKAKTKNQIEKTIISLIKKNKNYRPTDIVVKFPKNKQKDASTILRSLVQNQKVWVDSDWTVSLSKDNV